MDLEEIRTEIDQLDNQIVGLIAQRQKLVEAAGKLKKDAAGVQAPARVQQVLDKVGKLAEEKGADVQVVQATYGTMIGEFINLEMRELDK